jgi:hypothetical protein
MTLATRIYVLDPIDPEKLHDECNRLIGAGDECVVERHRSEYVEGLYHIDNRVDQGYPAWLTMEYGLDNMIVPDKESWMPMPYCICVDFDTSYGYKRDNGAHASDFHAYLVREVGHYLQSLPSAPRWVWVNEFDASLHVEFDGIEDLGDPELGAPRSPQPQGA